MVAYPFIPKDKPHLVNGVFLGKQVNASLLF